MDEQLQRRARQHAVERAVRQRATDEEIEVARRGVPPVHVPVVLGVWRTLRHRLQQAWTQIGPWLDFLIRNPAACPRHILAALRSAKPVTEAIPRERPPLALKPSQLAKEARETGKHLPARGSAPATVNARRGTTTESEVSTYACQPPS